MLFNAVILIAVVSSSPFRSLLAILSLYHVFVCLSSHCPFIVPVPRPSEPVLWAGPELLVLSLLSCHSPILPWCWLRTLAANRKSECHRDVSQRRLRFRSECQLHGHLPHIAVLLISGVSLQQVRPCPATRGHPGPLSLHWQHSEGSQVSLHAIGPFSVRVVLMPGADGKCTHINPILAGRASAERVFRGCLLHFGGPF